MSPKLATRLREGTAQAHRAAERMTLIQALLRGLTDRKTYAALVRAYLEVYTALEAALMMNAEHPVVGPLVLPELWRRRALADDLRALVGPMPSAPPSAATLAYCRRIDTLAVTTPELLVSHAYTRYLGDLAGGQVLGRIIGRALGLGPGAGLDFYDFTGIDDTVAYREAYRARLDALPVSDATSQRIVEEARQAFGYNAALFAELEGSALKGFGRFLRGRGRRSRPEERPLRAPRTRPPGSATSWDRESDSADRPRRGSGGAPQET
jgi:heme oxygenase